MPFFEKNCWTKNILVACMGVSFVTCIAIPQFPAFLMSPFFSLLGQGRTGFQGLLIATNLYYLKLGPTLPYCVAGTLGAVSLWYASRLDFDDPKEDRLRLLLPAALAFFFCALMVAFVAQTRPGATTALPLLILVFIGYPVVGLLPTVSFGLLLSGLVAAPSAYKYLSARYDLKQKFAGAVGAAPSGMSDLQKRLLARQAPPDHVVEDTERFHVENTISDLMIEVEMLRTDIEMLTQNRSGGRR